MCIICDSYEKNLSDTAAGVSSGLGNAGNYSNDYINGLVWGGGWSGTVYYTIDDGTYGGGGWLSHQETAIQNAVAAYNNVCGINISYVAPGNSNVDIVFATLDDASFQSLFGISAYGVHEVPDGTDMFSLDGAEVCYGVYNWSLFNADTDSFDIGGFDYITLIHELGHGLGLAHPHDDGGSSSVYSGVTSSFGDYGDNNLNQGVFTTMSYNDGWASQYPTHTPGNGYAGYGYQGTPMAFDIAALQELYGVNNSYQTGDNAYALPSYNADNQNTYWSCIWDAGGTDRIYNPTSSSSVINLQEAPLTGANAGGYLSYVTGIKGGFTIANGVVIERADGGSSSDTITGNSANNILNGNGGNDTIYGGAGNDTIDGGTGNDSMYGGAGDDTYKIDSTSDTVTENSSEGTDTVISSITFTLGNHIENLTLTGASGNTNGTGNSLDNTIIGDGWRNILTGGDGNDTLNGGGTGNVVGQDTLVGGAGDDTYYVYSEWGGLTNIIEGADAGTDTIISSVSYDLNTYAIYVENLTITGGSEAKGNGLNNIITADSGSDTLYGYGGNDTLDGGSGADTMIGGVGDDIYILDNDSDTITEISGQGTDTSKSSTISIDLRNYSNVENATLTGSSHLNITGSSLNNTITGNSGNNTLNGREGSDTLIGGAGDDIYELTAGNSWSDDTIIELSGEGTDTVRTSGSYTLHNNVENIILLSNGGYTLTGNILDNTISGADGNDTIDGGAGNDTMIGGTGDDIYIVDSSSDVVTESSGEGTDTVKSSSISLNLSNYSNVENLTLTGSSNYNLTGNSSANTLTGNSGNNTLTGNDGDDIIYGGNGDDTIYGNNGEDTLYGDSGNDTIWGYNNNDTIYGGDGEDTIYGVRGADLIYGGANDDWINASGNADIVYGESGDDYIKGHLGDDLLYGGDGNDTIDGNEGIDTVYGNDGNDTIRLHFGADVGYGGDGDDTILGYKGFDDLYGGAGNDTLKGGDGRDELYGEDGADILNGGNNPDIFYFHSNYVNDNNIDTIQDMTSQDTINLVDMDANSSVAGDQAFAWIGTSNFSGSAGELMYYNDGGNYYLQGDINGDSIYDFRIDLLTFSSLDETDIVF